MAKTVNFTGTATNWQTIDLQNVPYDSIVVTGSYGTLKNSYVKDAVNHGLRIGNWLSADKQITHHIKLYDFKIENSTQQGFNSTSWGSGLKVETNVKDVYIENGIVDLCGGEAVGITGAENVTIKKVTVKDGYKAEFYVDNSLNVSITDCIIDGRNPKYWRDASKANTALLLGDEDYAQTNHASKLGGIVFSNNVSYGCNPLSYWGGQVEPNGVSGLTFTDNTFYDSKKPIYIASGERNANIITTPNSYLTSGETPPAPTVFIPFDVVISYRGIDSYGFVKTLVIRPTTKAEIRLGVLDPFTKVQILEMIQVGQNVWGRIAAGMYIPLFYNGTYFTDWRQ